MGFFVSKIESGVEYAAALSFAQTYAPKSGTDYGWVVEHAEREYARLENIAEDLDNKADSLVRYLGVLVTAISVSFTYLLKFGDEKVFYGLPSLLLMLGSIVCAVRARMPERQALPMETKTAFAYADAYSNDYAKASSAAMTWAASTWIRLVNEKKGALIQWAFRLFVASIVWLVAAPVVIHFIP
jgi:membrane protein required for beta-lactamase induction